MTIEEFVIAENEMCMSNTCKECPVTKSKIEAGLTHCRDYKMKFPYEYVNIVYEYVNIVKDWWTKARVTNADIYIQKMAEMGVAIDEFKILDSCPPAK